MRRTARRGLTLTEALVASTLALVLGVLMVNLIRSGLSAHGKGTETRDAQSGVRNVLSVLVAELRSAAVPPLSEPLVATPVFWPGVWGAEQEISVEEEFYPRETTTEEGDTELDSATNRLLYVRVSEHEADPSAGPLAHFALVELLVPEDRPHTVERRIHPLTALDGALKRREVTGADGAARDGWLVDLSALSADSTTESEVVYDAGSGARVAFRVSHRTFEPVSDPGRTRFPQPFDPGVFRLDVAVAIGLNEAGAAATPWPRKEHWSTLREETTELRIPAVRQN